MDVSIIIVNYNTKQLLLNCIESVIEKTEDIKYELIVIDNNSTDSPEEELKLKFRNIIYYQSPNNVGFGNANNLGASLASGKFLFFLNSDTLLINNAIKILFDFWINTKNSKIGALGGNLYHKDFSPNFSYAMHFPSLIAIFLYRARYFKLFKLDCFNLTKLVKKVSFVIGADLFISKEIFNHYGGFDPNIFMYNEDCDLQFQLVNDGLEIFNIPSAQIIHLQGSSSNTKQKLIMEVTSFYYYFKKNISNFQAVLYLLVELTFCVIFTLFGLLSFNNKILKNYSTLLRFIVSMFSFKIFRN